MCYVDSHWIRNINADEGKIYYSIVNCSMVNDAIIVLSVSDTSNNIVHSDQQLYTTASTMFSICDLSSISSTLYYTLQVTVPGRIIASYSGTITSTITPTITSTTATDFESSSGIGSSFIVYTIVAIIVFTNNH